LANWVQPVNPAPPCQIPRPQIYNAIIGDGCVIKAGSSIRNSVIGLRTLVQEGATIEDTLILGADYYETKEVGGWGLWGG
jgi:glucose-1-phosphate adenylyltransferase